MEYVLSQLSLAPTWWVLLVGFIAVMAMLVLLVKVSGWNEPIDERTRRELRRELAESIEQYLAGISEYARAQGRVEVRSVELAWDDFCDLHAHRYGWRPTVNDALPLMVNGVQVLPMRASA